MSRTSVLIVIAGSVCLIVSVAATFWFIVAPNDEHQVATKAPSIAQHFDTTGGQVMQPRWDTRAGRREGEGDDTSRP